MHVGISIQDGVIPLPAVQLCALLDSLDCPRVHGGRRPMRPRLPADGALPSDSIAACSWKRTFPKMVERYVRQIAHPSAEPRHPARGELRAHGLHGEAAVTVTKPPQKLSLRSMSTAEPISSELHWISPIPAASPSRRPIARRAPPVRRRSHRAGRGWRFPSSSPRG